MSKKIWLTSSMDPSMWSTIDLSAYRPDMRNLTPMELKNELELLDVEEKDICCSLNNEGLVGTLIEKGIPAELNPGRFSVEDWTEVIYVIQPCGGENIQPYKEAAFLPAIITLRVTKIYWTVR